MFLGGKQRSIPTYLRGQDANHDQPAEFLTLEACGTLLASGKGRFINRGKAFHRTDKHIKSQRERDYGPLRGRATSRKIAEPSPTGKLNFLDKAGDPHVPMGTMTRYVADQNAGRKHTAVQAAVDGWRGARWTTT